MGKRRPAPPRTAPLSLYLSFLSLVSLSLLNPRPDPPTIAYALSHQFPQPLRFANGAGRISPNCEAIARRGGYAGWVGRRRGLSTNHQTGFNSLAAARPVVASASFLSSRRAKPPRQRAGVPFGLLRRDRYDRRDGVRLRRLVLVTAGGVSPPRRTRHDRDCRLS